jgi:hypothetical protein
MLCMRMFACAGVLALVIVLSVPLSGHDRSALAGTPCGKWRWPVKTLSDRDRREVDFRTREIRVKTLRSLDPPGSLSADRPRIGQIERRTYAVNAQVVAARIMEDSDIHMVIAIRGDRRKTMIVEFPHPDCVDSPFKRAEIRSARRRAFDECGTLSSSKFIDLEGRVRVRGVGFWDDVHGQTGVAPNGIELHPVLGFTGHCRHT